MTGVPRAASTQQPPDPDVDLTAFPARMVAVGTQWHREHGPRHRVVPELVVMRPYDTPRAWAHAFFDSGFQGIWGTLRHSSGTSRGLSVFGPSGPRDWPVDPHPTRLSDLLEGMAGMAVVRPPSLDEITIVPPA
ncbi:MULTISPECIES: hypothetical protein [Sanguibacter]|uniref:RES domain-containing protein n=1 Tax=Sanguibacter inulinus TaxID=60922 RepID=A0A853EZ69_9MICO|nr:MULTISPECIES: hypothetical protein [Sanguibacter]KQT96446.1 hypothetical protein ASG53_15195 [Sanguibacter sp. Leaf3]MBF0723999.1 hypothetical protein [Sanguibacter inulinus]NYS95144.1 hypothetical protein [Sanguibacter inulinus]